MESKSFMPGDLFSVVKGYRGPNLEIGVNSDVRNPNPKWIPLPPNTLLTFESESASGNVWFYFKNPATGFQDRGYIDSGSLDNLINKGLIKSEKDMKKTFAADVEFKSTEAVLNMALSNCKDWLKIMTGITESATVLQSVAEKAMGSRSHAKAFVDIIGMANKDSDLYTAVKTLFDTISAYAKVAKNTSIAQQVLEYVFTNVETYGGMEKLKAHLDQLTAEKDRLRVEFNVGLPGQTEKIVDLTVVKHDEKSPYSVKRAELLSSSIDLMKEYVADAGRSYKTAVDSIQNLTNFLVAVNEYSKMKKPEDRDRVEQQLQQNPLWENFKDLIKFPAESKNFEYFMDVKNPKTSVASAMLTIAHKVNAVFKNITDMSVNMYNILDSLMSAQDEFIASASPEIAYSPEVFEDTGYALAAMRRKALDMPSDVSTEEILRARKILEDAGIPEEIVFMLQAPEDEMKVAAVKSLVTAYNAAYETVAAKDPLKSLFVADIRSVVSPEVFTAVASMSVDSLFSLMKTPDFIGSVLKVTASKKVKASEKSKVASGGKTPLDSFKDKDGDTVYVLDLVFKNGSFMDKVEQVLNAGYGDFLFGELGLSDGITDKERVEYLWGSDVRDHLKAFKFDDDIDMYVTASLKLKKWNVIRDFGDHKEIVGTVTTNFDSPKSVALDKAFFKYNNNSSSTIGFRLLVEEVKDSVYTTASVSTADLEDMIKRFNEAGSTFYLGEAYGAYELWAKNSEGSDVRIDSGSRKDIKEALIKNRYNPKYRVKAFKKVEAALSQEEVDFILESIASVEITYAEGSVSASQKLVGMYPDLKAAEAAIIRMLDCPTDGYNKVWLTVTLDDGSVIKGFRFDYCEKTPNLISAFTAYIRKALTVSGDSKASKAFADTDRPISSIGLEKFQKSGKYGLRDAATKEVFLDAVYSWIDDVFNSTSGMIQTNDASGNRLAVELYNHDED